MSSCFNPQALSDFARHYVSKIVPVTDSEKAEALFIYILRAAFNILFLNRLFYMISYFHLR
jgi:hypothetical protein